jgi:hypothetical protein
MFDCGGHVIRIIDCSCGRRTCGQCGTYTKKGLPVNNKNKINTLIMSVPRMHLIMKNYYNISARLVTKH